MNKEIIDSFIGNNVLVLGDVMIDKYLTGKIERISPEAPVPIVHLNARDARLGGAANVTLSLKSLEAEPILFSVVGDDENAKLIKKLLQDKGINSDYILNSSARKTTVKSRILASNQQILRVDEEDTHPLTKDIEQELLSKLKSYLENEEVAVIIFQDYNKGVLTPSLIKEVIKMANAMNIPTIVDPKRDNFWVYREVTCFKPNLKEVKEALNQDFHIDQENLNRIHKGLQEKLDHQISLITLSEHGIFYADESTQHWGATQSRKIADVCGAGDAVLAIVALCIARGVNPTDICLLANLAGGQVCEKVGVVPIEKTTLCRELGIID